MATLESTVQNPLESSLLARFPRLQQAGRTGSKMYVKRGEKGNHVIALQKAVNRVWHFNRKRWGELDPDGKFGGNTFAALKACQKFLNRENRRFSHSYARTSSGDPRGTESYKEWFNNFRTRIKDDGIVGPATLQALDQYVKFHWIIRKAPVKTM